MTPAPGTVRRPDAPAPDRSRRPSGPSPAPCDGAAPAPSAPAAGADGTGAGHGPRRHLVASDLDRTLIYSAAALHLTGPDAQAPRLLCVETYQHAPLSYLTETAAGLLTELAARAVFVPATTRTPEQYRRVRLPGPPPRYAICANGGELLVDGEPDPDWRSLVRARLADCAPLEAVTEHLRATAGDWLLKRRTAEDLFAYLVVDRDRLPARYLADLSEWAEPRGWTVSLQGRKLYTVPRPLTKSAAVAEVARRTGTVRTYTAGDSLLDADLLLAGDRSWRPGHGELAETGWTSPRTVALPERGVAAGERLLRELLAATAAPTAATGAASGGR